MVYAKKVVLNGQGVFIYMYTESCISEINVRE